MSLGRAGGWGSGRGPSEVACRGRGTGGGGAEPDQHQACLLSINRTQPGVRTHLGSPAGVRSVRSSPPPIAAGASSPPPAPQRGRLIPVIATRPRSAPRHRARADCCRDRVCRACTVPTSALQRPCLQAVPEAGARHANPAARARARMPEGERSRGQERGTSE